MNEPNTDSDSDSDSDSHRAMITAWWNAPQIIVQYMPTAHDFLEHRVNERPAPRRDPGIHEVLASWGACATFRIWYHAVMHYIKFMRTHLGLTTIYPLPDTGNPRDDPTTTAICAVLTLRACGTEDDPVPVAAQEALLDTFLPLMDAYRDSSAPQVTTVTPPLVVLAYWYLFNDQEAAFDALAEAIMPLPGYEACEDAICMPEWWHSWFSFDSERAVKWYAKKATYNHSNMHKFTI